MKYTEDQIDTIVATLEGCSDAQLLEDEQTLVKIEQFDMSRLAPMFRDLVDEMNQEYIGLWRPLMDQEIEKRGLTKISSRV